MVQILYLCTLIFKKIRIMTKAELVHEIWRKTGVDKTEALNIVESFMNVVKDSVASGENVYLRGFGTFEYKKRAEKVARNISKNTTIVLPEHHIPAFKPAKEFVKAVKKF